MAAFKPIHLAAWTGDVEAIKTMIREDPMVVNTPFSNGDVPLHYCCWKGDVALVMLLLDHGACIDQPTTICRKTPLYVACEEGRLSVVEMLLTRGADPATAMKVGSTPLMIAAFRGDGVVVQCLLRHASLVLPTIDARDERGRTALWWACYNGHSVVVRMMLEAGADPTLPDGYDQTPMEAARDRCHDECIRLLEVSPYLSRLLYAMCDVVGRAFDWNTRGVLCHSKD